MDISEALFRVRERKGWTQAEVAEKMGCTRAYISQLETGKREAGLRTLRKLSRVLGLELHIELKEEDALG